jgi:hypothetical protein
VVRGGLRGVIDESEMANISGKVCRICLEEEDPNDLG